MKKSISISLLLALITVFVSFVSCDKEDDKPQKPIITLTEVGHDNSKIGHPGHDMHLVADIVADGLIKRIDIEIHQEEGSDYEIEFSFTDGKYIGVRNTEFHEHLDIPADAPLGEYHLHFTVTDGEGQQTTVETHIDMVEGGDDDDDED